ncbi:MAG: glycosyltransferase family 1 protein [Magnetospirillum sp.]|nr:MAG: glycosyltransferase family 1 protein [Magnetospirillum sp.]
MTGRAFVVGAHIPNGGTFMAYHLGRILQLDFGFQGVAVAVGGEAADHGVFAYDPPFPSIGVAEMESTITDDDLLIANPSFSPFFFGLKCRGRKVMYVQDFKTFSLLDCRFDLYVSVSEVVRRFLSCTWGIDTAVIPPFIQAAGFPPAPPWRERPADSVLVLMKGDPAHQGFMLDRLRQLVGAAAALVPGPAGKVPRHELVECMGRYRHVVTLSVAEGFGLMPLEAMAMGATLLGFDGIGGRDYMRSGVNCAVVAYPDLEGVAESILAALRAPDEAEALAMVGWATATAPLYTQERFRADWSGQFARILGR